MFTSYVQAVMLAILLSLFGFGFGWIISVIAVQMVERRDVLDSIRQVIAQRARLETAFEHRRETLRGQFADLERAIVAGSKRRQTMEKQLIDVKTSGDVLVRLVGDENADYECFLARIGNRYVSSRGDVDQKHAFIDSSWASPQIVEIWAPSMGEARSLLEKRYPPAFGYTVHHLSAVEPEDLPKLLV